MTSTSDFLRANPVVIAILAALVIVCLVFGLLAFQMIRSGALLKPLVFMAVFMGIVGGPQIAFHLGQAFGWIPKRNLTWIPAKDRAGMFGYSEQEANLAIQEGRFANPAMVFGAEADQSLISDLRAPGSGGPFDGALAAQMAIIPPTSSVIAARFQDAATAAKAAERYLLSAVGQMLPVGRDGSWTFPRPAGDVVKVLVAGRTLLVLTGPDEATLDQRSQASQIIKVNTSDPANPPDPKAFTREDFWLFRPGVLPIAAVFLVVAATLWFFKGSSWASAIPARPRIKAEPTHELRQRLLAINSLDVPFTVQEESPNGRLIVTWRYADAKWFDLARVHGKRATHRILLELDEKSRAVRPTDQMSAMDWSARPGTGAVHWRTSMGITFFQIEHGRVLGLQMNERGQFTQKLSYAYTFNLQEMKAPFVAAATQAGWDWRPTVWQGPSWLRWLTN